jgi:antitoxin component YwqK of YwqJK toxin-antitoxin module
MATWSAGRAADGRVLLDGEERFFYKSGKPMWTVHFHAGRKSGEERYQREDGTPIWVKNYAADGTWIWQNYDDSGKLVATSHWKNKTLESSDVPDQPTYDKTPGQDKLGPPPGM